MSKKIAVFIGNMIKFSGWERALEAAAESGYDGVDFDLNQSTPNFKGSHMDHDVDEKYLLKVKAKADSLGLAIPQTHGHLGRKVWSQDEESKKRFVTIYERDLRASAILGAEACVIHSPDAHPVTELPTDAETLHRISLDGYTSIVPYAEKYNVKITLESLGRCGYNENEPAVFAQPRELIKALDAIPTKMKSFCLDTGHTHQAAQVGVEQVEDFIRIMGSRIEYLHMHDSSGFFDDHSLPGIDTIHWKEVFAALKEIGYKGYYNYELGYGDMGYLGEEYIRAVGPYLRKFTEVEGDVFNKERFE